MQRKELMKMKGIEFLTFKNNIIKKVEDSLYLELPFIGKIG